MEQHISLRYLWFKTAKYVWDATRRMYSDLVNASQVFELHSKLKAMKHGTKYGIQYKAFSRSWICSLMMQILVHNVVLRCGITLWRNKCLNFWPAYQLGWCTWACCRTWSFPNFGWCFSRMRHEEKHRKVMLPDDVFGPPPNFDVSALISIIAPPPGPVKENDLGWSLQLSWPHQRQVLGDSWQTGKLEAKGKVWWAWIPSW